MTNFYKTSRWKSKREKVLRRDEYCCQECKRYGKTTAATTVHHIHPLRIRPDLRLTTWNLVSLCGKCHDKMHDRNSDELTGLGKQWEDRVSRLRGES
jgi:5-methylcytosine-specific restriction enzyme A